MTVLVTHRNARHGSRTLHWQLANHLGTACSVGSEEADHSTSSRELPKEYRWVLDTICKHRLPIRTNQIYSDLGYPLGTHL